MAYCRSCWSVPGAVLLLGIFVVGESGAAGRQARVFGGPSKYGGSVFTRGPRGPHMHNVTTTPPDRTVNWDIQRLGNLTFVDVDGKRIPVPRHQELNGTIKRPSPPGTPQSAGRRTQLVLHTNWQKTQIDYAHGLPTVPVRIGISHLGRETEALGTLLLGPDSTGRVKAYIPDRYDSFRPDTNALTGEIVVGENGTITKAHFEYAGQRFEQDLGSSGSPIPMPSLPLASGRHSARVKIEQTTIAGGTTKMKSLSKPMIIVIPEDGSGPLVSIGWVRAQKLKATETPGVFESFEGNGRFSNTTVKITLDTNTGRVEFQSSAEFSDAYRGASQQYQSGEGIVELDSR